jgi:hypothetical protein
MNHLKELQKPCVRYKRLRNAQAESIQWKATWLPISHSNNISCQPPPLCLQFHMPILTHNLPSIPLSGLPSLRPRNILLILVIPFLPLLDLRIREPRGLQSIRTLLLRPPHDSRASPQSSSASEACRTSVEGSYVEEKRESMPVELALLAPRPRERMEG